ncbi:hypothetical protein [Pseudonocardia zijingensis]|uniref:hypothetical protein n=1 Tax=Pseudonocardia zijingensis TaxID=153376 RepID=UPI0031CFFEC5
MEVLGIEVEPSLVRRWAGWLAPARQPFFLTPQEAVNLDRTRRDLPGELRDTYEVWNVPAGLDVVWLDERAFRDLPRRARAALVRAPVEHGRGAVPAVDGWTDVVEARVLREQADGHHFVWWPSLVEARSDAVLERVVSDGHLTCRRASVPVEVWRAAAVGLPRAEALSGTFAEGSGPNCFGTVMAAAGVPDAAESWMQREPFEAWLDAHCAPGGEDDLPGTVLVWRDADLTSTHAAVTLGGGWALHKPSQSWASPRQVVGVGDLVRTAAPGVALHRYSLRGAPGRQPG